VKIKADENIVLGGVNFLRKSGHDVASVRGRVRVRLERDAE
jgi:hypothetical protein